MTDVFVAADNIISPLGSTTRENFDAVKAGSTGVRKQYRPEIAEQPFYAALMEPGNIGYQYSKFEGLLIASIGDALQASAIQAKDKRTALIVCSTKGNIHLLDEGSQVPHDRLSLPGSAAAVARHLGFLHTPMVISNACISGLLGLITGKKGAFVV